MQLLSFKNLENMKMTLPAGISFKFFPHNNLLKYFFSSNYVMFLILKEILASGSLLVHFVRFGA